MRFEQIVAVVTRNLVQAMVREAVVARSFVNTCRNHLWLRTHLWLRRMSLDSMPMGISSHSIDSITPDDFAALARAYGSESELLSAITGLKRGGVQFQPCLVLHQPRLNRASYPARSARG